MIPSMSAAAAVGALLMMAAPACPAQTAPAASTLELALKESVSERIPVLRVEGRTDLPDGCRLSVTLYYTDPSGTPVQTRQVEAREGRFVAELPFEGAARVFPGLWIATAGVDANQQPAEVARKLRRLSKIPTARQEARIGTSKEADAARAAFLGELAQAFDVIEACRKEATEYPKPGDAGWKMREEEWLHRAEAVKRFNKRMERKVLGLKDPDGALGLSVSWLQELIEARAAGDEPRVAQIGREMELWRVRYLHAYAVGREERERGKALYASLVERLGKADLTGEGASPELKAAQRTLLELGACLPQPAHSMLTELAAALGMEGGQARARRVDELLKELSPWFEETAP
jgi:hypothetical protein